MEANIKIEMTPITVNLSCTNCVGDNEIQLVEHSVSKYGRRNIARQSVVMSDFKCKHCGCNSFNMDLYYSLNITG